MALETDTLNTYGNITGCPTDPPPPVGYRRSKMSSLLSKNPSPESILVVLRLCIKTEILRNEVDLGFPSL